MTISLDRSSLERIFFKWVFSLCMATSIFSLTVFGSRFQVLILLGGEDILLIRGDFISCLMTNFCYVLVKKELIHGIDVYFKIKGIHF
jgi:hypothetical protein